MKLFGWVVTREEHAPVPLLERMERVENTLARLTKDLKALEVDWESVLDKIARYTARQAARTRRQIEADTQTVEGAAATPGPTAETASQPLTQPIAKKQLRAMLASGQLRKLGG